MGKLEKVGAAVVGVLLCIIVAVGILNQDNKPASNGMTEAEREAERQRKDMALRRDDPSRKSDKKRTPKPRKQGPIDLDDLEPVVKRAKRKARKTKGDGNKPNSADPAGKGKKPGAGNENDVAARKKVGKDDAGASKDIGTSALAKGDWPRRYTVKRGDILGKICAEEYGTSRMVKAVLAANPGLDPRKMIPGKTKITLPAPDENIVSARGTAAGKDKARLTSRRRPSFVPNGYVERHAGISKRGEDIRPEKGYYIVRKNDSLSSIAQKQLGSVKFTKALLDANRGLIKDPNNLRVGWKLKLPNVN